MSIQGIREIRSFIESLAERVLAGSQGGAVLGLGDDEIRQLRNDQGVSLLPLAYETFLRFMGRQAGRFMYGTDAFFPAIIGLKADAREFMSIEGVDELLPDDAFVFAMHQGYQVYWFRTGEGDDPPTYKYQEGDATVTRAWSSFTEFLATRYNSDFGQLPS